MPNIAVSLNRLGGLRGGWKIELEFSMVFGELLLGEGHESMKFFVGREKRQQYLNRPGRQIKEVK